MAELMASLDSELQQRAKRAGHALAFMQKRHGIWHQWTWAEVETRVAAFAAGLQAAGLQPGQAVGLISGARTEAVLSLLACQRANLVPVLLNPNLPPGGLATLCQQASLSALICEDQEQVDKVADIQTRLQGLQGIWVIDTKGCTAYQHIQVTALHKLLETGSQGWSDSPKVNTPAVGLFSAGIFTEPRLLMVSHATLLQQLASKQALALQEGSRCISLFGLADPLGFFLTVVAPVLYGTVVCFGESRLPSLAEMRQCTPDVVALPSRLLDRLRRETAARANRSGGWRSALIQRWIHCSKPGFWMRALVGQPIAASLGLLNCKLVLTGYDRMTPVSARFLARLGMASRGLYGLAEAAGPVAAFEQADAPLLEVFPPFRPSIDSGKRLQFRVADKDIESGDLVTLEGGHVHLVGREADLLTLADGQRIAPNVIEVELMTSPYVNQAVAVGGPSGGITALVELDDVNLRDWARQHGLAFTTLRSFAQSSEVHGLIALAVAEANQRLVPAARIGRFVLLPRALEPSNGELTPALAVRRAIVRNRYAHRLVAKESA